MDEAMPQLSRGREVSMDSHGLNQRKGQRRLDVTRGICLCVLLVPLALVGAQEPRACPLTDPDGKLPMPAEGTSAKVRDLAFPAEQGSWRTGGFMLVLRFLPSFHAESQIVVRYTTIGGTASVDYRAAQASFEDVWRSYYCRNLDNKALLGLMAVQKSSLAVPDAVVQRWFEDLWRAWVASAPILEQDAYGNTVQLDGTRYNLDYYDTQKHLSLSVMGSEIPYEEAGDLPIVQWMRKVLKDVEEKARQQPQGSRPDQRDDVSGQR